MLCHVQQQHQHEQEHKQQEINQNVVVEAGGLDHYVCISLVGRPTLAHNVYYECLLLQQPQQQQPQQQQPQQQQPQQQQPQQQQQQQPRSHLHFL